jgi:glycosyltransferase involved in cell wall biosynthesis
MTDPPGPDRGRPRITGTNALTTPFKLGDSAPRPPELRSESEITAQWRGTEPIVSVLCPTYQHAEFIEDSLKGMLGQVTDFPFVVIVRDDASTDGTAEIVREYAARYPRILRAILEPVNRYPAVGPLRALLREACSDVIALCEGDDYWIDPNKIQTQLQVMRASGAVASHHLQLEVSMGEVVGIPDRDGKHGRDRSALELRSSMKTLPTRTIMFRRSVLDLDPGLEAFRRVWSGDLLLTTMIGCLGPSIYADVAPAVYRIHGGGISTMLKADLVVKLGTKSQTAERISVFLAKKGFPAESTIYRELADERTVALMSHLFDGLPSILRRREWHVLGARLVALRRATRARTLARQVLATARTTAQLLGLSRQRIRDAIPHRRDT